MRAMKFGSLRLMVNTSSILARLITPTINNHLIKVHVVINSLFESPRNAFTIGLSLSEALAEGSGRQDLDDLVV